MAEKNMPIPWPAPLAMVSLLVLSACAINRPLVIPERQSALPQPPTYHVELLTSPGGCSLTANGQWVGQSSPLQFTWPAGHYALEIQKDHYQPLSFDLALAGDVRLFKKLLAEGTRHRFRALVACGSQPKQVLFSPDGRSLVIPLLDGPGLDEIDLETLQVKTLSLGAHAGDRGFVEAVFNQAGTRLYVSQMSTGQVHAVDWPSMTLRQTADTRGTWTKVLALSPDEKILAASNWESGDISLLDAGHLDFIRKIKPAGRTPRGLAFTPDGSYLFVAYFDSGDIVKVSTRTWTAAARLHTGGADRHVIVDRAGCFAYVDNMKYDRVYKIDARTNRIVKTLQVGSKPNTLQLTPDARTLYVSCRGPNNPQGYLLRSPQPGSVVVIDTSSFSVSEIIPGGTQPTGLAISPDGKCLAFSNFQDNTIELYDILPR